MVGVKSKPTFGNVLNQGALPKVKTCSNFLMRKTIPKVKKPIIFKATKQKTLANKREEDTSPKTKDISLFGKESFSNTEDPGISWMSNSTLECGVQIH